MLSNRFVNNANSTRGRPITLYVLNKFLDSEEVDKDELFANITSIPTFYVLNEVANPVQYNKNMVNVRGKQVQLSDYVLPTWFNPEDTVGPYNYTRTLTEPFSLDPGGYMHFFYQDEEYSSMRPRNIYRDQTATDTTELIN